MPASVRASETVYRFGPFCLDVSGRQLEKDGAKLPLGGRAFDILVALVSRHGALAAKADLMDQVWPGIAVTEGNLTTQVLNARKLLARHDPGTTYIVTDAGRGYRFVAQLAIVPRDALKRQTASIPPIASNADDAAENGDQHNLPAELNAFVGRVEEMGEIRRRLSHRALLTIAGPGGIGKTRCALRVVRGAAGEFADGAWLVDLAPLQNGTLVAEALCRVLGLPVAGDRTPADMAAAYLRTRETLLIFDGCEHVLQATAELADTLLKRCPHVKMLITSREKLGIDGETVYRVPSLPLPPADPAISAEAALRSDAVRLFVARAEDAVGAFELTDADAPAVASICRSLDGVAMAIELAAARVRMLKPAEIAVRLEDMFHLLTGGSKAALLRQQTLRATIDWSYALLSPAEQGLLRRLSVFANGFSLDGAIAICGGNAVAEDALLELLTALVDKSLVMADQSGNVTRYRMLAATRHYANEKLRESGEPSGIRRLAMHLVQLFERAETEWETTPTAAWLAEFGPEIENLRAAIDWAFGDSGRGASSRYRPENDEGDPAIGIALVAVAGGMADEVSLLADIKRWTAAAIPHLSPATPKARAARVLHWATRHLAVFGVRELSTQRRRAIALFREAGDTRGLSAALRTAGLALARPGERCDDAYDMVAEAVSILRPMGPSKGLASALAHLGAYHYLSGNEVRAREASEAALNMRRALGDRTGELLSYINIAEFAFARGDTQNALAYAVQAQRVARACQLQEVLATVLTNLANYQIDANDLEGGRATALEALALHRVLGNDDYRVVCLEHMALTYALGGAPHHAARLFGYTDGYFRSTAQVRDRAEALSCARLHRALAAKIAQPLLEHLMQEGGSWSTDQADAAAVLPPVHMRPRQRDGGGRLVVAAF